jgi:hypothetical protein
MSQDIWSAAQRGRQSSLYWWLADNHDRFAEALRAGGRPDWPALAGGFAAAELRDSRGHPPSAEICRRTWVRVGKNAAKRAQRLDAKQRGRAVTAVVGSAVWRNPRPGRRTMPSAKTMKGPRLNRTPGDQGVAERPPHDQSNVRETRRAEAFSRLDAVNARKLAASRLSNDRIASLAETTADYVKIYLAHQTDASPPI